MITQRERLERRLDANVRRALLFHRATVELDWLHRDTMLTLATVAACIVFVWPVLLFLGSPYAWVAVAPLWAAILTVYLEGNRRRDRIVARAEVGRRDNYA